MVYCAHCGTQNRDGSKFCNNCGARLAPESGLRCPMCSTPNPVESVFCVNCGARLVPLTAVSMPETKTPQPPIKGLSLPAKPELPSEPKETTESVQPAAVETPAPLGPDELPDWIARLRSVEPTADESQASAEEETRVRETPAEDEAGVPDWLSRLRETPMAENAPPMQVQPEEIPDWIKKASDEPAPEAAVAPAAEEEMPDWLKQAQPESTPELPHEGAIKTESPDLQKQAQPESTPEPPHEGAIKTESPDWLKQAQPEPIPEPPHEDSIEVETPDWLKQPQTSALPGTDEKDLPDWLRTPTVEAGAPEEKAAEPVQTVESEQAVAELEPTEPLLKSLEEAETAEAAEREPMALSALPQSEDDELPDWLRTTKSAETPAVEQPLPGEVPAWVAELKPAGVSPPHLAAGLATNELEIAGPLEGLRGVLPLAVAIAEPHRLEEAPKLITQTEGGQIFESILAAPAETGVPVAKTARFVLTMRPFVYLAMLLAVLVPFLLPYDLTQSTFNIAGTPAAEFFDTLRLQVPANSTVLLSFDYDPSLSGEMDLQARAIVSDLIKRRVKIIAVSTIETGPQIAQRVLDAAASETSNYAYGTSYLIVYLPGHEAGLAQLAATGLATATDFVDKAPVSQFLTAARIRNLGDLPMVIEFAGSEEPLKIWVEQVQPRTGVRIVAAVSAAVEPKARAYRNANQLTAMISGLLGAAQYEALSNQPGLAVISVNAQTTAQLVIVFLIVLGNVVFWISRARGGAK